VFIHDRQSLVQMLVGVVTMFVGQLIVVHSFIRADQLVHKLAV